jgi:GTPase
VGFVRHLPHQLVEAFRSTLEETAEADLLLHVVDAADALPEDQIKAVRQVLVEVGEQRDGTMPRELLVVNKTDVAADLQLARLRHLLPDAVFVSAHTGDGIDRLRARVAELLPRPEVDVEVLLPYTQGSLVARVHADGEVLTEEHTPDGTRMRARVGAELATAVLPFLVASSAVNGSGPAADPTADGTVSTH